MVKARKYVVKKYFEGLPKKSDYELVESELPALKNGEILVKTEFISVDPYLRAYNTKHALPYDQFSHQVGVVQESKNPKYAVGDRIFSHKGWVDYYIINPNDPKQVGMDRIYKLPNLKGLSNSHGVGALGMPGVSAYYGFLDICQPKAGETVVVTGAAGAVGTLVGQIAKIKGCRVIGFAGSDDKVEWLEKDLGFDKAFNYKKVDIDAALKEAAPKGVDCYFDNVGGEISSTIIRNMNPGGRNSICGSISVYNEHPSKIPKVSILQPSILYKELKIEGFIVYNWGEDKWMEAVVELAKWIKSGQLKPRETITDGFENLFDAFVGMLNGENFGKAVVKV